MKPFVTVQSFEGAAQPVQAPNEQRRVARIIDSLFDGRGYLALSLIPLAA